MSRLRDHPPRVRTAEKPRVTLITLPGREPKSLMPSARRPSRRRSWANGVPTRSIRPTATRRCERSRRFLFVAYRSDGEKLRCLLGTNYWSGSHVSFLFGGGERSRGEKLPTVAPMHDTSSSAFARVMCRRVMGNGCARTWVTQNLKASAPSCPQGPVGPGFACSIPPVDLWTTPRVEDFFS